MIEVADSIVPEDLPGVYGNYLVYVDGRWPTVGPVRKMFPSARLIRLTVTGETDDADGCDQESGDLGPNTAAMWLKRQILSGKKRPVLYASRDSVPPTLGILAPLGTGRADIRILTAHYGQGNHICSPAACKATFTADGTQWTDTAAGVGGTVIDLSTLNDDFFGAPAPVITMEADVKLTQLQNGSTGQPVQNWQGILVAHGLGHVIASGKGDVMQYAGVDGQFGAKTAEATKTFQVMAGLPQTGVVDAATWQKALG